MTETGLVSAYRLDGNGGGTACDWQAVAQWQADQGVLWVHLNRESEDSQEWLRSQSGLDELVVEALLAENTRPRCSQIGEGLMLFLRGVNLNPGAEPEDMVSIRLWVEASRIISLRLRHLMSIDDIRLALEQGKGPVSPGDFVITLAERLSARMAGVVSDIDERVDSLQELALEAQGGYLRQELTRLRREVITLRRYLAPQREALDRLTHLKLTWLDSEMLLYLREESNNVTRYIEDLDAARERAAMTQDELSNRLSEQMNARMYVLSIVAGVFLPLGFLTGLLGINVGGIPLAESPSGFLDVTAVLVLITAIQLLIFRWRRWL